MFKSLELGSKLLLAGLFASSIVVPSARSQVAQGKDNPGATPTSSTVPAASPAPASTLPPSALSSDRRSIHAEKMYERVWGIRDVHVRETASGSIIRFSYVVVDSGKAKVLNDPKLDPVLTDPASGDKLGIPETENAGKLRQVADPENGREYWMVFLNNKRFVKPGSRVNIAIGTFRAEGLVVEPSMPTLAVTKP
jgi:hypothetical protein